MSTRSKIIIVGGITKDADGLATLGEEDTIQ